MNTETIVRRLGAKDPPTRRTDGDWITIPELDVRAMARLMAEHVCRFVTLTVVREDDGPRFIYHWDVEGQLLSISTQTAGDAIPSIADVCPAADWAEREACDFFAIEFTGRTETPPLMLRDTDEPGFFNRTVSVCRRDDPSDTDWAKPIGQESEVRG